MATTLHELIDQVRDELLMPRQANTPEAMYPFLFVDEVELEVGITVSGKAEGSGKISIHVVEAGGGGERAREDVHRITVKMTPLLTKDEIREHLKQDARLWEKIQYIGRWATTKEAGMAGEE